MSTTNLKQIKVVLLGDSGVGKSSIMIRYITGNFQEDTEPTLGGGFISKVITYKDKSFKYQIWDTAGQEKYQSLMKMYYRAILVYDVTKHDTFESLKRWVNEIQITAPPEIEIVIVGNKVDLEAEVPIEQAEDYAKELKAKFQLTSAKTNKGIEELFQKFTEELYHKEQLEQQKQNLRLKETKTTKTETKGKEPSCC